MTSGGVNVTNVTMESPGRNKTRSLDIGCGSKPELPPAHVQVGLDVDFSSLLQSRHLFPHVLFVCADGERLPFRDSTFDAVTSRVALPLMNLNAAIPEISRVMKPGGEVKMNLHHLGFAWRDLIRRTRTGRSRAVVGGLWSIANGFIFHFFGRTFRLPGSKRFYDSFQTLSGMKRILHDQGFDRVGEAYIIRAQKKPDPT
jgi:SAM-dependent methyltransferase